MARKKKMGAGYRQRADGRIEYRWSIGDRRFSVCGRTLEECKEKEAEKRKEIESGSYVGNRDITLDKYFIEYANSREGRIKDATQDQNRITYKRISPVLGNVKVREIERRQVILLQDQLKNQYKSTTVNDTAMLLSSILNAAMIDGIIDKNPCFGVKRIKHTEAPARETIHRALTREETERFFSASQDRGSWFYNLYAFLLNSGMRIGEAVALRRSDIDTRKGVIHIRRTITRTTGGRVVGDTTKTRTSKRDIPFTPALKDILQRQEQLNREVFHNEPTAIDGLIFRTMRGKIITSSTITKDMEATQTAAGIDHFSAHAFRDTFATFALESGMTPQTLKEVLGHSSFSMTMDLYAHVLADTKADEMAKVVTMANA